MTMMSNNDHVKLKSFMKGTEAALLKILSKYIKAARL